MFWFGLTIFNIIIFVVFGLPVVSDIIWCSFISKMMNDEALPAPVVSLQSVSHFSAAVVKQQTGIDTDIYTYISKDNGWYYAKVWNKSTNEVKWYGRKYPKSILVIKFVRNIFLYQN